MEERFYRVYILKNGFKFLYDFMDSSLDEYISWLYDNDLIDLNAQRYFSENEMKTQGVIRFEMKKEEK